MDAGSSAALLCGQQVCSAHLTPTVAFNNLGKGSEAPIRAPWPLQVDICLMHETMSAAAKVNVETLQNRAAKGGSPDILPVLRADSAATSSSNSSKSPSSRLLSSPVYLQVVRWANGSPEQITLPAWALSRPSFGPSGCTVWSIAAHWLVLPPFSPSETFKVAHDPASGHLRLTLLTNGHVAGKEGGKSCRSVLLLKCKISSPTSTEQKQKGLSRRARSPPAKKGLSRRARSSHAQELI